MRNKMYKHMILIGLITICLWGMPGNALALDWIYQWDSSTDAAGSLCEVYRLGYAYDEDSLYVNMLTDFPVGGKQSQYQGWLSPGDLYINVGGSHNAGTGTVFGLAMTSHAGDMNGNIDPDDNGYAWTGVTEGHLYQHAVFSTGTYESYSGANEWAEDGGNDPFGDANNIPAHIAEFGLDLGFQGDVSWQPNTSGLGNYLVSAVMSLEALGLEFGGVFEMWWSEECGNELAMMTGEIPDRPPVPEPSTILLLVSGLIGLPVVKRRWGGRR